MKQNKGLNGDRKPDHKKTNTQDQDAPDHSH